MCIDALGSAFNEKIDLLMISLPKIFLQILYRKAKEQAAWMFESLRTLDEQMSDEKFMTEQSRKYDEALTFAAGLKILMEFAWSAAAVAYRHAAYRMAGMPVFSEACPEVRKNGFGCPTAREHSQKELPSRT